MVNRITRKTINALTRRTFSPRASTPGGSVVHSDMSIYQPLLQTDFRHGMGFSWYTDVAGYQRTEGNIDTRHAGLAMLFPALKSEWNQVAGRIDGFCVFKNNAYYWGTNGVFKFATNTWSQVLTGTINYLLPTSTYLFAFPDGARPKRTSTGETDVAGYAVGVTNLAGANNDMVFTSRLSGATGNNITIAYVDDVSNPNPPLAGANGYAITVIIDAGVTTAAQIKTAIEASPSANALISVANRSGNTGAGTVPAMSALTLSGGSAVGRKADYTTQQSVANSNLKFTAVTPGTAGNNITIAYQTGATAAGQEIVTVNTTNIVVTLHADSTALQVLNALLSDVAAYATGTTKLSGDNNDLTFTAVTAGVGGNDISVVYKLGASAVGSETCSVSGNVITVTIHKNSTASHVIDVIRRTATSAALINVALATGNSGAGKVAPSSAKASWTLTTTLKNGSTASAGSLVSVELATAETGAGKPGVMAAMNLQGGSGTESWIETGVDADAKDYRWAIIHNGRVYAGEDGNNLVHYASQTDLSDLEGTENDPGVVKVGAGSIPTLGAIVYAGNLYLAKEDGLWQLAEDGNAKQVLNYSNEASADNFRSMVVHNGYLIYPIRDRIIQWNGVRESNVSPGKITDTWPYVTYGRFDNLVAANGYLYMSARTNESTYKEDLLCWDGVGWHRLSNIVTSTDITSTMNYDVINNRLWVGVYHTTTNNNVYYIQFQSQSDYMNANFPTAALQYLYLSRMDAGFRRIIKSSPSIIVEADNCAAAQQYLTVDYCKDGSSDWNNWGTVSTNGAVEIDLPSSDGTIEYNSLQLRVGFLTSTATQSPILEGITLRFLLRPEVHYAWSFMIPAATDQTYGTATDKRSTRTIITDLETARDSKAPIIFKDIWGIERKVYVTSVRETVIEQEGDADNSSEYEMGIQVNLLEVG